MSEANYFDGHVAEHYDETFADSFDKAAAHLEPGGCFVIEVLVPELERLPPGETARPFLVASSRTLTGCDPGSRSAGLGPRHPLPR